MFFSTQRTGLGRILGGAHNPNINQQNGGVKKEQVKGCGSVNRPTPGSQCPAEPATSGFLQGVKISKIRGQISGLGVKLWVVGAGFSRPRAILHGVKVWVVAVSCFQQGKQSARLSAVHFVRGTAPDSPSFFSLPIPSQVHLKICAAKQRIGPYKIPRPAAGVKPPKARPIFLHPVRNIGLDITAPSRVVLVVEENN